MAKIYGQLEKAQLENTTSDTASHPKGMITYRTDLNQAKVSNGTSYKLLIDEDSTQTLSNKTYASPSITGALNAAQTTTPANPASGENKLYFKADGKLYTLDAAGNEALVGSGGGGVKNLITNGNADDTSSSIFVPYADAASTRPVDGTGGSPTVTTSMTTSTPLDGAKSFLLTKPASNVQGQGWSVPFTVDPAYRAKSLKISVDYIVNSGTFVAGGTSTESDIIWYIYDVTNSQLIEPSNIKMFSNNSSISDKFEATFQSSSTGSSYRLIAHVQSVSALAYELKVDNITVSPQTYVFGTPVTDWVGYTPTFNGLGTVTNINVKSRRVGDSLEVAGYFQIGTPTASLMQMTLGYNGYNGGVVVDSNKIGGNVVLGVASPGEASTTYFSLNPISPTSSVNYVQFGRQSSTTNMAVALNGNALTTNVYISVNFKVPISGWSSNVQMSNDTDTRVISAFYNGQPTGTLTSSDSLITIPTKVIDTSASMSSGTYTVPVAGKYSVTAQVGLNTTSATANQYFTLSIKQNGTLKAESVIRAEASSIDSRNAQVHAELDCAAGDTITLTSNTNMTSVTYNSTAARSYVRIERLSGPSAIAASETVATVYTTAAGQSIPNNSETIINFETKEFDSHGAVTTGAAWKFTAPISGTYEISAMVEFNSGGGWAVAEEAFLVVAKNGGNVARLVGYIANAAHSTYVALSTSPRQIKLVAGDYINLKVFQNSGAALGLLNAASTNWISIKRIGN